MTDKAKIFDKAGIKKHIGTEIKFRDRLKSLQPVEEYFRQKCKKVGIEYSYDCTADENTYFKTINYTTFAGLFMMHPLSFGQQIFQMYDAKADRLGSAGHVEWVQENLKANRAGKYTAGSGSELEKSDCHNFKAVAVLPGSNKFYQHVSKQKFQKIVARHGSELVIKPHPITNNDILGEVFNFKGKAQMAGRHEDLYDLINRAETVYTTHISETALTSLLLGKKISPLEPFGSRLTGSFSHVAQICFSDLDPIETIKDVFASPKSGIVHPDIDKDWKGKIDEYFEYSMAIREKQKGYYYE